MLILTLHVVSLGNVEDEVYIGVVVVIGAALDLAHVVGHLDVLRVGLEVLRGDHDHEADGALLRGEVLVGPAADGADAFYGYRKGKWRNWRIWVP